MNVIYHKNCLDGVYSAYLLYLLAKFTDQTVVGSLIEHFKKFKQNDITSQILDLKNEGPILKLEFQQLTQDLFLSNKGIQFSAYGIVAGKYQDRYGYSKSSKKILFIVDNNCESQYYIKKQSQRYDIVLIIDHHTSFKSTKTELEKMKLPNVYYIWREGLCATQLTLKWLQKHFSFLDGLQPKYRQDLEKLSNMLVRMIQNNLKIHSPKVLFLDFTTLRFKCLSKILGYLKGWECQDYNIFWKKAKVSILGIVDVYIKHFQQLQTHIKRAIFAQLKPYNSTCLVIQATNPSIISDIGTVLSYISCKIGGQNIAILYIPSGNYYRVSCRSYKGHQKKPLALQLSLKYGGGGHNQAAGFRTSKNSFNGIVKKIGAPKFNLNLTIQQIQSIMFHKSK